MGPGGGCSWQRGDQQGGGHQPGKKAGAAGAQGAQGAQGRLPEMRAWGGQRPGAWGLAGHGRSLDFTRSAVGEARGVKAGCTRSRSCVREHCGCWAEGCAQRTGAAETFQCRVRPCFLVCTGAGPGRKARGRASCTHRRSPV